MIFEGVIFVYLLIFCVKSTIMTTLSVTLDN